MQSLNKKGLSEVVQTSLIILLSISAIFTLWGYVKDLTGNLGNQLSPTVGCIQQKSEIASACIDEDGKVEVTLKRALGEEISSVNLNLNGESFSCGDSLCQSCIFTETENQKVIYLNPLSLVSTEEILTATINDCQAKQIQLINC